MIIGIVGSEEAKFTVLGAARAKAIIRHLLTGASVEQVVSGGCHLGGIDKWAAQIGMELEVIVTEYFPKKLCWTEYKARNLLIVHRSDEVHCITVRTLPADYTGMRFKFCYHCVTDEHVKSGGCWTMKQAMKFGKPGKLHVVENY